MERNKDRLAPAVLVVDNFEAVLEIAADFLEQEGFTVVTARSGNEALKIAEEYAGEIDVLLTEEQMPGMPGAVLAARLRLLRPRVGVIVMSATLQGKTYKEYEAQLGAQFLWKPFTKEELLERVCEVRQGAQNAAVPRLEKGQASSL
jgi:two-component system, cell cycle sensor histidine kinase and response regulator CckA